MVAIWVAVVPAAAAAAVHHTFVSFAKDLLYKIYNIILYQFFIINYFHLGFMHEQGSVRTSEPYTVKSASLHLQANSQLHVVY